METVPEATEDRLLEMKVSVLLSEFEQLKNEMLQSELSLHQTLVLVLGSLSIVAPLLGAGINNLSISVLRFILYLLVMVYSGMTLNYCWYLYAVFSIGKYLNEYTQVEINQLLKTKGTEHELMTWEPYIRKFRQKPAVLVTSAGAGINALLTLIPSSVALIGAQGLLPFMNLKSESPFEQLIINFLPSTTVLASLIFLVGIISVISAFFLVITNGLDLSAKRAAPGKPIGKRLPLLGTMKKRTPGVK